jgi:acetylornithine deacetylase/succinyl-diaminopimelate desuccinylase-like protein
MTQKLIELATHIQQVPAPTFEESLRAQFVLEKFRAEGLDSLEVDPAGNVLARLPGRGTDSPLLVSAHLDTVFPAGTDLAIRRDGARIYGPGLGDNSLGVAALFGLIWGLRERSISLPGDLWLVANTGEEGLGDLKGMKSICDRFGAQPKGYLVLEGLALGHVYHRGIGVRRYRVICHAAGGHSWTDYGQPSAIHALSALITQIAGLKLPSSPRTTLNVGRISGGTSINTLAAQAWMELDLRSENASALDSLVRQVENLIEAAARPGLWFDTQVIGQRPAGELDAANRLVKLAQACLREQGLDSELTAGSTDANIPISRGYPALVLGLTSGGGAHTVNEYIETAPLAQGLGQLIRFVEQAWG